MRRSRTVFALFLPFALCILGSWAWFNTNLGAVPSTLDSGRPPGIWLTARTNIPGFVFIEEPVSDSVKNILGTTNILSGTFVRSVDQAKEQRPRTADPVPSPRAVVRGPQDNQVIGPWAVVSGPQNNLPLRVTVFVAAWAAEVRRPLLIFGHTPEICWTRAGWKPVDLGLPQSIVIDLPISNGKKSEGVDQVSEASPQFPTLFDDSQPLISAPALGARRSRLDTPSLPFICRAFQSPDARKIELAVWCTLVAGRVFQSSGDSNQSGRALDSFQASILEDLMPHLQQFLRAVATRIPARGRKQFVRYSAPISDGPESATRQLSAFAPRWLVSASL